MKSAVFALVVAFAAPALAQEEPTAQPASPAEQAANAGATPIADPRVLEAFHGKDGAFRIADDLVDRAVADPRIGDIFKAHDLVRLKRTLGEQFCYILGGGCAYTGKGMAQAHKDLGLQISDMNVLVEDLQLAMDKEGVPFRMQNRLLAKLAPMKPAVVVR